jgi:beta-glucosidase
MYHRHSWPPGCTPASAAQGIEPLFGFGYGLSYTTFDIAEVSVNTPSGANAPVAVTASVTGSMAGAEGVEVCLGMPVDGQPPKRLVGFQKVFVEPGESAPHC